jgi:transposase
MWEVSTPVRSSNTKLFLDWAAATVPIYHRQAGEIDSASLFVAVQGASSDTFLHATRSQDLWNWVDCHVRAFEFFEGVPKLLIPDNPRTGVSRACRYEPELNRTYQEMD